MSIVATPETEAVITKVATAATYAGATTAAGSGLSSDLVFGLTSAQWSVVGVIGGLVLAVLGFAVNVYFRRQHLKLAIARAYASLEDPGS